MSVVAQVQSIAVALSEARFEIAKRWLDRIAARVAVEKELLFPSENLLDEVPVLIDGLAHSVACEESEISTSTTVVAKARELGSLRFDQGFSSRQILWEYDILGNVILQYLDEIDPTVGQAALPQVVVRRLLRGLAAIQRASIEAHLVGAERQVHEREERLRSFNRALSHEVRNEVSAILGAGQMLREPFIAHDDKQREKFAAMIISNASRIERVIENLLILSRTDPDPRQNRNVLLPHAAHEVARRLRNFAEANGVSIEVETLPELEVNAAVVDLALTNLIANGIKYRSRSNPDAWVRVRAAEVPERGYVVVEVSDNGIGIPEQDRPSLFDRFFRAENAMVADGTGLGLSLVSDAIKAARGQVWADFPESGGNCLRLYSPGKAIDRPVAVELYNDIIARRTYRRDEYRVAECNATVLGASQNNACFIEVQELHLVDLELLPSPPPGGTAHLTMDEATTRALHLSQGAA